MFLISVILKIIEITVCKTGNNSESRGSKIKIPIKMYKHHHNPDRMPRYNNSANAAVKKTNNMQELGG